MKWSLKLYSQLSPFLVGTEGSCQVIDPISNLGFAGSEYGLNFGSKMVCLGKIATTIIRINF